MGLLDGKTAIITGSARGIGRATAELFAAEGAQVTINDIDGDIAQQSAGEIKGETVKAGEGGPEVSIGVPEQMRNLAAAIIPLGRPAQPEEAAGPVLFLASPLANYIHGQVIPVTGGQFGGMYC